MGTIQNLQEKLYRGRENLEKREALLQQREAVEHELLLLEKNVPQMEKEIEEKLLSRRKIDHHLDDLEYQEEDLSKLENELIHQLLLEPGEKSRFDSIEKVRALSKKNLDTIRNIFFLSSESLTYLNRIASLRQKVFQRGLLSFLFGKSPTSLTVECLKLCEEKHRKILSLIEECDLPMLSDFYEFLKNFSVRYDDIWSTKRFNNALITARSSYFDFAEALQKSVHQLEKEHASKEAAYYEWLFNAGRTAPL